MTRALGFILISILAATSFASGKYDRKEKMKGVSLQTGKDDDLRNYRGFTKRSLPYPADVVLKSILSFSDHCNNDLSNKREFTPASHQCRYHDENIIESFVVSDLKPGWLPEHGEVNRFVVGRKVYNRGVYGYYELVQVIRGKNKAGQTTHVVSSRMLEDKEAKKLINVKLKQESSFEKTDVQFVLTEASPTETEVNYTYESSTRHWVLNKEFSVGQVFSSISSSINHFMSSVAMESQRLLNQRTPASSDDR